jgi:hypothetical protein
MQAPPRLARVIAEARPDPLLQRFDTADDVGGCWNTAHRFALYCQRRNVPYRFRRWRNLPELRTPFQHNIESHSLIVCWTR